MRCEKLKKSEIIFNELVEEEDSKDNLSSSSSSITLKTSYDKTNVTKSFKCPGLSQLVEIFERLSVKNLIVMVGAGISTSVGIPDFRTPGTGLYSNLERYNLPYPEAIFDIQYFLKNPEAFYKLTKELYPGRFIPSLTHYFLRLLELKGVLRRVFTQNIDTLERISGITDELIVEAHGSFATSRCLNCKRTISSDQFYDLLGENGNIVRCLRKSCRSNPRALIKPDIVFFGEGLPTRFFDKLSDFEEADLLIVIGTSLNVQPFASLIDSVPENCPRLLINLERVGEFDGRAGGRGFDFDGVSRGGREFVRDVLYLGKSDEGVLELCKELGWEKDLLKLYESDAKQDEKLSKDTGEADDLPESGKSDFNNEPSSDSTDHKIITNKHSSESDDKDLLESVTNSIEKFTVSE
ncbi:DHS-like NAD/FAD-binding domain-containing protein [Phakopsora pachyrhizi]|uniref:NAD-dependent protein deacetylase n=1 Tax=Phakopsora pachyrhizi TaxID=170000 RepID=A0AAV0ASE3_PHAPC|nr:DHS-like NAD/FAD-binding domain-containing protein [Phakopsora pachyrhizi]